MGELKSLEYFPIGVVGYLTQSFIGFPHISQEIIYNGVYILLRIRKFHTVIHVQIQHTLWN
jgi:hypothetical protein